MDTTTGRIAPGWARTRGAVPEGGDLLLGILGVALFGRA